MLRWLRSSGDIALRSCLELASALVRAEIVNRATMHAGFCRRAGDRHTAHRVTHLRRCVHRHTSGRTGRSCFVSMPVVTMSHHMTTTPAAHHQEKNDADNQEINPGLHATIFPFSDRIVPIPMQPSPYYMPSSERYSPCMSGVFLNYDKVLLMRWQRRRSFDAMEMFVRERVSAPQCPWLEINQCGEPPRVYDIIESKNSWQDYR